MNKWKRLSRERVFDNKYFKVNKDVVELPDGRKIDWLYWDSVDAAMVIPVTPEGKLVMIKQYRYLPDQTALEFPAGHGDADEAMESCAERELAEETGYKCDKIVKLGSFHETMSQLTRKIHIYLGTNATKLNASVRQADENEVIEVVLMNLDEVAKMVVQGKIISMGTSLAVMLAREKIKNA